METDLIQSQISQLQMHIKDEERKMKKYKVRMCCKKGIFHKFHYKYEENSVLCKANACITPSNESIDK